MARFSRATATWAALVLALSCGSAAQTYPATVEFDVVFPRNDTYAPAELLPVVFAIQNPQAAGPLTLAIEWSIGLLGSSAGPLAGGLEDLAWGPSPWNSSSGSTFYVVRSTNRLNGSEGAFSLLWTLHAGNCSASFPGAGTKIDSTAQYNNVKFTLQQGAPQPDVQPPPGVCPVDHLTFNVTGTLPVPDPTQYSGHDTCAVLAQSPPPSPTPCAATADAAIAASISAAITASACAGLHPLLTHGCPPAPAQSSSLAVRSSWLGGMVVAGVAVGSGFSVLCSGL